MKAGRLDRRISVLRSTQSTSDSGSVVDEWSIFIPLRWATIDPVKGDEQQHGANVQATEQVMVYLRWSALAAAITPKDRIVYPSIGHGSPPATIDDRATYRILTVAEVGRRDGVAILAERRSDT